MKPNEPQDWPRAWRPDLARVHETYPVDGRETVFDPYETFAPTRTVGGYLDALRRVRLGDTTLPADFALYLRQRVPASHRMLEGALAGETPISRTGVVG